MTPRFVDPMHLGVAVEYDSPEALLAAAKRLRDEGYDRIDAYTPYPVPGLEDVLAIPRSKLPIAVFLAGLAGAAAGYLLQWYVNTVDYPLDVGGRPIHSAPPYLVIAFETMVLFAASTAFAGFFLAGRLPELWNPLFEVEGFDRASVDRFWLGIDERDLRLQEDLTVPLLRETSPLRIEWLGIRR